MKTNKRGHIVTIASVAGLMGCPGMMDYCASKFGSIGMEQCIRYELQNSGESRFIKSTCIAPYLINTGMFEGFKQPWPFSSLEPALVADRTVWAI
jgi:all-trans-retinol dehydrogenase (NAD+)